MTTIKELYESGGDIYQYLNSRNYTLQINTFRIYRDSSSKEICHNSDYRVCWVIDKNQSENWIENCFEEWKEKRNKEVLQRIRDRLKEEAKWKFFSFVPRNLMLFCMRHKEIQTIYNAFGNSLPTDVIRIFIKFLPVSEHWYFEGEDPNFCEEHLAEFPFVNSCGFCEGCNSCLIWYEDEPPEYEHDDYCSCRKSGCWKPHIVI